MVPRPVKQLRGRGLRALLVLSAVALVAASGILVGTDLKGHKGSKVGDSAQGSAHHANTAPPVPVTNPDPTTTTTPPTPGVPVTHGPVQVAAADSNIKNLPVYPSAGATIPFLSLPNPNSLGAPLNLLVITVLGQWVLTYVPVRPNGSTGWVPMADVTLSTDPYQITISVVGRMLTLYQDGSSVYQVPVAVGAPDSPTPLGDFFVVDVLKLTDPWNAYGPYALGLSGFSNTYYSFDGGPGEIAVHGTNQPWVIGGYASHGCVRLANSDITKVAQMVPPGTPVDIGL